MLLLQKKKKTRKNSLVLTYFISKFQFFVPPFTHHISFHSTLTFCTLQYLFFFFPNLFNLSSLFPILYLYSNSQKKKKKNYKGFEEKNVNHKIISSFRTSIDQSEILYLSFFLSVIQGNKY